MNYRPAPTVQHTCTVQLLHWDTKHAKSPKQKVSQFETILDITLLHGTENTGCVYCCFPEDISKSCSTIIATGPVMYTRVSSFRGTNTYWGCFTDRTGTEYQNVTK